MPQHALFVGGLRTPFGRAFKGAYSEIRPDDLLTALLCEQVRRRPSIVGAGVDDVIVGCAYPEGEQGYNLGRMAALGAGLEAPGLTLNRLCASSLESVAIAAARIAAGWGERYLVAGVESMSRVPRRGANFSESAEIKRVCQLAYIPMGDTAEIVAQQYPQFPRGAQEDLAERSHEFAHKAYERGDYASQIFAHLIDRDEFIRYPVNREKMATLPPAFAEAGSVTAATSSPLTDGATSGWVIDRATAEAAGVSSAVEILDATVAHVPPEVMGMGPVPAMQKLFTRNKLTPNEVAVYEINEAFAIQVLASAAELGLPSERINTWGGAMALGHPLGASGLRLVMTAQDRLAAEGQNGALAIVSLCVGGGMGMALLLRYVQL
ncbi:thiolase family protein [Botrimarina hoheduenensis]|uniref:acetyl-CoA C-acyltransferase n=1 Tax=Botrimarina hoheduenensis TaxID=2528000 RepID=A0A5C5WAB3_9BACT|nr:thiolase family protein [Botrimarina hoheduenensis]TWT47836.1 3-ketoacyl-CoA thiolase [Botrimarina hoheduenensis]